MNDKELDDYMKTVNPDFNLHLGKRTIEMNNEYYDLLQEKMIRLINENKELKKQNEECEKNYFELSKEILEYTMKLHKNKIQEKKFIKWLEDGIQKIKNTEFLDEKIQKATLVVYNRVLSKYNEINRR